MPLLFPSASSHPSPEEVWTTAFNKLSQRVRPYFVRPEPHLRALAYVQVLLSSVEQKNGWQVAEEVGGVTPYAMQHLLDRAWWDCDGVRDELRIYIWETHAAPNAVLVIDEIGFLKKGRKSVGVHLNAHDVKAVRKTVSGLIKLLYPDGEISRENMAEPVDPALEGCCRAQGQLKKTGSFEYHQTSFSYIDNETHIHFR